MNVLKRLILVLLGLALIALVTMLFLLPERMAALANLLVEQSVGARIALAVVADLVILAVLFLLLRAPARHKPDGLVVQTSGALADVSLESAQARILKAVRAVPGVVTADAKLQAQNGRADIDLNVGVAGENINLPEKQKEIDRALRQVTLKQLGLKLSSRPRVHIQLLTDADARALQPTPPVKPPVQERYEPAPVVAISQPIYEPPPAPPRWEPPMSRPIEREPEPAYLEEVVADWTPPEPLDEPEPVTETPVMTHVEVEADALAPEWPEAPLDVVETELDTLMLSDIDPDHEIDTPPDSTEVTDVGLNHEEDDERDQSASTDV